MNEQITTAEQARLAELESVIESNVALVGKALFEIRESRLYRQTHKTFEEYCQERFAMSRQYINKQIKAAEVVCNLETNCFQKLPSTEGQARPLSKLPAADQPKAWERAQEIAKEEGKQPVARHVEQAVAETIEAVVVDGTKDDERPEPKRLHPTRVIESEGMNIWKIAKIHLDRINKHDEFRVKALEACAEYCKTRLEKNK